jgi:hypothetical protein
MIPLPGVHSGDTDPDHPPLTGLDLKEYLGSIEFLKEVLNEVGLSSS